MSIDTCDNGWEADDDFNGSSRPSTCPEGQP
jgi:hypothetical protein